MCIWQINKEDRSTKVLQSFKVQRNIKFLQVMDGGIQYFSDGMRDRIWLGFESGDQDAFEYDGK
jgi:hypothetical protein